MNPKIEADFDLVFQRLRGYLELEDLDEVLRALERIQERNERLEYVLEAAKEWIEALDKRGVHPKWDYPDELQSYIDLCNTQKEYTQMEMKNT